MNPFRGAGTRLRNTRVGRAVAGLAGRVRGRARGGGSSSNS